MIVESLGTTGSGKSTLIPILIRLLRGEGWQAMSATEGIHFYMRKTWVGRLVCFLLPPFLQGSILWRIFSYVYCGWHTVWFVIQHPRLMGYVTRLQFKRQIKWSHRLLILRLYVQMVGWSQFFRCHVLPGQVIFLDEGFVHRATHLFVSEEETPDPEQVNAYLQLLPSPDLVMWVRAPVDLCLSRVYARGVQVRLAHLNPSQARRFFLNSERVCQIVVEYTKKTGWSLIEMDNVNSPEVCAAKLCQAMIQHLS